MGVVGEVVEVADCGLLLLGVLVVFGALRVPGAVATRDRRCEPLEFGFSAEFDGED